MNKNDKKIYNKLNKNIVVPKTYIDTIYNTLNNIPEKENKKQMRFQYKYQIVLAICCSIFLISTTVFGKNIDNFFHGIFINHKGITSAIENDFIEINNNEYSESNNAKAYIDSLLMDDYKLCICFKFQLPFTGLKNITNVEIPNILIYDENENVLFNQFYEEIDYSFFDISTIKNISRAWSGSYDISFDKDDNQTYYLTYIINSEEFPKSRNIYVKFNKINLINKDIINNLSFDEIAALEIEERKSKTTIGCINGKWNLTYNLSEKTYNRENYIYKVKNFNDYNYNFPEEIVVSNTETRLNFSYDLRNILNGEDISNDKNPYIRTEYETLNITNSNHEYIGYKSECDYTFDLSIFNATPTMQLIMPIENGEEIMLELERK